MPELKSAADNKGVLNLGVTLPILVFFVLDRILKNIFLIKKIGYQIGLFKFSLIKNNQVIFGYFPPGFWFYLLVGLIFIFLIYKLINSYRQGQTWLMAALILVILGGFSNLLDRIKYDFVIDYIHFLNWSFFNLADLMIWAGIIIIVIKTFASSHQLTKDKIEVE